MLGLGNSLVYPNLTGEAFTPNGLSTVFDGADDFAAADHYTSLTPGANSASGFSVSVWFNSNHGAEADLRQDQIVTKTGSDGTEWKMVVDAQRRPRFFLNFNNDANTRYRIFMSSNVTINEWNHMVFTWDATKDTDDSSAVVMYLNGVRGDSSSGATVSNPGKDGSGDNWIVTESSQALNLATSNAGGGAIGGNTRYKGYIDELSIFNVTLDDDAVTQIYNSGDPIDMTVDTGNYDNSSSLVAYWRMGEDDGGDGDTNDITNLSSADGATDLELKNGAAISNTEYAQPA